MSLVGWETHPPPPYSHSWFPSPAGQQAFLPQAFPALPGPKPSLQAGVSLTGTVGLPARPASVLLTCSLRMVPGLGGEKEGLGPGDGRVLDPVQGLGWVSHLPHPWPSCSPSPEGVCPGWAVGVFALQLARPPQCGWGPPAPARAAVPPARAELKFRLAGLAQGLPLWAGPAGRVPPLWAVPWAVRFSRRPPAGRAFPAVRPATVAVAAAAAPDALARLGRVAGECATWPGRPGGAECPEALRGRDPEAQP